MEISNETTKKTTTTKAKATAKKERAGDVVVKTKLFKDSARYNGDVFVAVNGKSALIQRGVEVEVKQKFAKVIERSIAQDSATAALKEQARTK